MKCLKILKWRRHFPFIIYLLFYFPFIYYLTFFFIQLYICSYLFCLYLITCSTYSVWCFNEHFLMYKHKYMYRSHNTNSSQVVQTTKTFNADSKLMTELKLIHLWFQYQSSCTKSGLVSWSWLTFVSHCGVSIISTSMKRYAYNTEDCTSWLNCEISGLGWSLFFSV